MSRMGLSPSRMDKTMISLPDEGRYLGLENFGNTCYCNSVLQALYFCPPFRDAILRYAQSIDNRSELEDNIYTSLANLFNQISNHRKKSRYISPKRFVKRLRQDNEQFRGFMHQDAHEFLTYLFLRISEILEKEQKSDRLRNGLVTVNGPSEDLMQEDFGSDIEVDRHQKAPTWFQQIFEGKLVHETKCLQCETVTSREEVFMDLQLAIEHNCSLTSCLKKYNSKTVLEKQDKYFCEVCQCHQEAYRQNKIKQLPQILICHLMRFDDRMRKLMDRVVFPMELKLCNTTDDAPSSDDMYNLVAIVVHSGSSMNHGHYFSLVKSHGQWLLIDDEHVEPVSDQWIERTFGTPGKSSRVTERGYILFYEKSPQQETPNRILMNGFDLDEITRIQETTMVSRSETLPKLESSESEHPSSSVNNGARSDLLSELESLPSTPKMKKRNRSPKVFTNKLRSLWNGSKVKGSRTTNAMNGNSVPPPRLNRSLARKFNADTNNVHSPSL